MDENGISSEDVNVWHPHSSAYIYTLGMDSYIAVFMCRGDITYRNNQYVSISMSILS
jgi:hypothetical protein